MDWQAAAVMALIFFARIGDVTLGTLRTMSIIHGRRWTAWMLGLVEVLIWVFAVSAVVNQVTEKPWYALAYALGFASGNFVGITVESWLAHGDQVIRIFTRKGEATASRIRAHGHRVTEIDGRGRDGPVAVLFIKCKRREAREVCAIARQMDADCFYIIDDVRVSSAVVRDEVVVVKDDPHVPVRK